MERKTQLTHADLRQFTGDVERFRHGLNPQVIYTPGVKFLAERAGAHWLIDAIAFYFGTSTMKKAIALDDRLDSLQFWRLDVKNGHTAVLTARADSDVPPFVSQQIHFTDFPLAHIDIWAGFDGKHWTLYLPTEH